MRAVSDRILRAFALVVTDRRWTAPLSATALGFGLFVGVAIGPSAAGTLAGPAAIVGVAAPGGGEAAAGPAAEAGGGISGGGGLGESLVGGGGGGLLKEAPLASAPLEPAPPPAGEPAAGPTRPASEGPAEEEGAEGEEETELKGVVVHANPAAGSYALAIEGGELVPVHARKLPPPGAKLSLTARRLANGTFFAAEPPKRSGRTAQVAFRGVVTYADPDPDGPAYTVSGRGASLLVHIAPDPVGVAPQLPAVGLYVTVTARLERREAPPQPPADVLVQSRVEVEAGEPATYLDLAGIAAGTAPETGLFLLSADGAGTSGANLALGVPPGIDAGRLKPGDSYLATATLAADGSLTLAGIASDDHTRGADDPTLAQGDLKR